MFMQSFCHTAAYPKAADVAMQASLPKFVTARGGVALRPGDGVIHSWLNRLLVPDTVGTGGDSHTRFPVGISFPAGSGLVAFAGALGFMPLDMPESVLVRFTGALQPGLTLRDAVNAIPLVAIKQGLLTVRTDYLELYRVTDLVVEEPLGERILGYGRVVLVSSDRSQPKRVLRGVRDPEKMADLIRQHVESQKRARRITTVSEA
jgi:hypothetical protein